MGQLNGKIDFTLYFSHDRTETYATTIQNSSPQRKTVASKIMATIGSITLGDMFDVHSLGSVLSFDHRYTWPSTPGHERLALSLGGAGEITLATKLGSIRMFPKIVVPPNQPF